MCEDKKKLILILIDLKSIEPDFAHPWQSVHPDGFRSVISLWGPPPRPPTLPIRAADRAMQLAKHAVKCAGDRNI